LLSFSVPLPTILVPLSGILTPLIAGLSPLLVLIFSLLVLILGYLLGYWIASVGIFGLLPGPPVFPLAGGVFTPVPTIIGPSLREFFGRGLMIGITAMVNSVFFILIPKAGLVLASYAFTVISLSAVVFIARNVFFQGFLAWSSWLFPLSHLATLLGLVLFVINAAFSGLPGLGVTMSFDFTTGVAESSAGLVGVLMPTPGFCLGNFIFTAAAPVAGAYTAPSTQSHETGHTLTTSAMGGVVLYINAIDENILPRSTNLAYGELIAEGHAQLFGTTRPAFFIRLWV
jgi:hypothetical protein